VPGTPEVASFESVIFSSYPRRYRLMPPRRGRRVERSPLITSDRGPLRRLPAVMGGYGRRAGSADAAPDMEVGPVTLILWIIAVILVVAGIVAIVRGQILWGVVLIIIGLLVGPGGVSVFDDDDASGTSARPMLTYEAPAAAG
jgi:fatty acid desaturase